MMCDNENYYEDPSTFKRISGDGKNVHYYNEKVSVVDCPTKDGGNLSALSKGVKRSPIRRFVTVEWILVLVGFIAVLVMLAAVLIWMSNSYRKGEDANKDEETPQQIGAITCLELKNREQLKDGVYTIKPTEKYGQIEVFCDMTTDDGGWTLVASVHESDINLKCDSDDLWSLYSNRPSIDRTAHTNWENDMTFGNLIDVAKKDYKNLGYSYLNASDVMLWHVGSGAEISELKSASTLRYRTTNEFLSGFKGNLKNLYSEHFPIKVISESDLSKVAKARTTKVLNVLVQRADAIKSLIPDWNEYEYDDTFSDRLTNDLMYGSFGNQVNFWSTSCAIAVQYGQIHECPNKDTYVASEKSHPFFAVASISNLDKRSSLFYFQVNSYRHTSEDNYTLSSDIITDGNFKLRYNLIQFYTHNSSTVAEFHFLISNVEDWLSVEPTSYPRGYNYNDNTQHLNRFVARGLPSSVVMGYTLLSRSAGMIVTPTQAQDVSREILAAMKAIPDLFREFESSSISVPITFDQGDNIDVMSTIPPSYRSLVSPGFMQFRAYNYSGFPNALCPGVKVSSSSPEYVCIGGISNDNGKYGTCGDFAGWRGTEDDVIQFRHPTGSAHAFKDIYSTILLFYR